MKNLILIIIYLSLNSISLFCQGEMIPIDNDKITKVGHQYYYQNEYYNFKDLRIKFCEKTDFYEHSKSANQLSNVATLFGIASIGGITGSLILIQNCEDLECLAIYPFFLLSAGAGTIGLIIKRVGITKQKESIEILNSSLDSSDIG